MTQQTIVPPCPPQTAVEAASSEERIVLVDLKAQYNAIKTEIDEAIARVLASCAFVGGPEVRRFEEAFAAYCGTPYAVGASSGTAALHLALMALDVGPGDEVIAPAHTFIATVEPIVAVGARIVFADVDPRTYTIAPESVADCITPRTKVIMPVHLYGQMADMHGLAAVARASGQEIAFIEDAAQAHGATQHEQVAGSVGRLAAFSFYPGKNLGAYGDGGAVTTHDGNLAHRVRSLADHGRQDKYRHDVIGLHYRLDGLQAAILDVKLRHLSDWSRQRRAVATRYSAGLRGVPGVTTPTVDGGNDSVFHLYVIQVDDRNGLRQHLLDRGIAAGVHYPIALHQQPALAKVPFDAAPLPVTERLVNRIVSLPMHPAMTPTQIDRVIAAVADFQRSARAGRTVSAV